MDSFIRTLQTVDKVVPVFVEGIEGILTTHDNRAELWTFCALINSQIMEVQLSLSTVENMFTSGSGYNHTPSDCIVIFERILSQLDSLIVTDMHSESTHAYPHVEMLILIATPSTAHQYVAKKIRALPKTARDDILKNIAFWVTKLTNLLGHAGRDTPIASHSKIILQRVHDLAGLLFMAAHQGLSDSLIHHPFAVLLDAPGDAPRRWQECVFSVMSQEGPDVTIQSGRSRLTAREIENIRCICEQVGSTRPEARLNMLVDDGCLRKTRPTALQMKPIHSHHIITLEDMHKRHIPLSRTSKVLMALLLAISVAQLCDGPWLPHGCQRENVCFLQLDEATFLRPLISTTFSTSASALENNRSRHGYGNTSDRQQTSPRLALGILLLELLTQEPASAWRKMEDLREGKYVTVDTDLFAAYRKLELHSWDVDDGYRKAVEACLEYTKDLDDLEKSNPRYHEMFYKAVVAPLEQELFARATIPREVLVELLESPFSASKDHGNLDRRWAQSPRITGESMKATTNRFCGSQDHDSFDGHVATQYHVDAGPRMSLVRPIQNLRSPRSSPLGSSFVLFDDLSISKTTMEEESVHSDGWFDMLRGRVLPCFEKLPTGNLPAIKVAILDTGIDTGHSTIVRRRRDITWKDFVEEEPLPVDIDGHGTHIAGLILLTAPHAHIYVARVSARGVLSDPETIARAIVHATNVWKVDVINMSFGFPKHTEELQGIQDAIKEAHSKDVLMFAAARNGGAIEDVAYPANASEVICVNAARGRGTVAEFNPASEEGRNLSAPGVAVKSTWLNNTFQPKNGTSFATPIAAGVAASTLNFVRRKAPQLRTFQARKIRTRRGMMVILKLMSKEIAGFHFLIPWRLFDLGEDNAIDLVLSTLELHE